MECMLSFIIPSYNVAWCLEKAVDSMLCGSCLEEMEILIVDDGSTDQTARIADQYAARYPKVIRCIHKENGGHGSTINVGARQAKGKYFKVVDADDWIITEHLPRFIEQLRNCEADVVLTPYHRVNLSDGSRQIWKMYCEEYERSYSLEELVNDWKKFDRCCMFHGIAYRTEFYRQYDHLLPEHIFYEDHEYSAIPFCHAESIYPMDLYLYQYLVGNSEQSISDKNRLKRLSHSEQVTKNLLIYRKEHGELSESGWRYLTLKAASGIPSYYEAVCIIHKNKRKGRADMARFNQMLRQEAPDLYAQLKKKARVFRMLGILHVPFPLYNRLHLSKLYSRLRNSYALEKESQN